MSIIMMMTMMIVGSHHVAERASGWRHPHYKGVIKWSRVWFDIDLILKHSVLRGCNVTPPQSKCMVCLYSLNTAAYSQPYLI